MNTKFEKIVDKIADYLTRKHGGLFTVTPGSIEVEDGKLRGFDLDFRGIKWDGGSYYVEDNGDIYNAAAGNKKIGNIRKFMPSSGLTENTDYSEYTNNELASYLIQLNNEKNNSKIQKNKTHLNYVLQDIKDIKAELEKRKKVKESFSNNKLYKLIETIVDKKIRTLKETVTLDPDFGNLDQFIYDNMDEIRKNMEIYGWETDDIEGMSNPYDVAHLLGVDSRLVRDADLEYITKYVHGILKDMETNESLNEASMTKYYSGFLVYDDKSGKKYKFRYVPGQKNTDVENAAFRLLRNKLNRPNEPYAVSGFVPKGQFNTYPAEEIW